ncbi:hypothetical protein MASR2M78_07470 [Treponema sp.]
MISEQFSTDIVALGLELKHILNWTDNGVLFPSFLVISTAIAGLNIENKTIWNMDLMDSESYHWNTSAGLGFRFNDAFGLLVRAGLHRSIDTEFKAFVALDIGSIGVGSY